MVSARKNARSAHVEIEGRDVREGRKGECRPIMPRGEHVCWSIFICLKRVGVFQLCSSLLVVFVFLFAYSSVGCPEMTECSPFSVSGLNFFACWLCMAPTEFTTYSSYSRREACHITNQFVHQPTYISNSWRLISDNSDTSRLEKQRKDTPKRIETSPPST